LFPLLFIFFQDPLAALEEINSMDMCRKGDLIISHGHLFLCSSSVFYASGPGMYGCSLGSTPRFPRSMPISVYHTIRAKYGAI